MERNLRRLLIKIKEDMFYFIFMYGNFDLQIMKDFNNTFNNFLNKFINI